jgi:predicted O-methyltransferase YrrM
MPWESRDPNMPTYWEDKFRAQLPHVIQIFGDIHASQQLERLKSVLDGRSIDLLFIDADHSYEGGLKHWYMYRHLVRSRGLVAFHDVRNGWPVGKFYDELCLSHEHREFCESVNPYGIGVITLP